MKKMKAMVLCLVLVLSLVGCGNEEYAVLQAEDVQNIISNYFSTDGVNDGNYIDSKADTEKNVVIVKLKDIDEKKQDEFIYNVFSHRTGSIRNI